MIAPKPAVQLGKQRVTTARAPLADDTPLFPDEPPMPRVTSKQLPACAICELRKAPVHPEHTICVDCAANSEAARARLEGLREALVRQQHQAAAAAQAAYAALSEAEHARWETLCWLRVARDNGDASPADIAKLARTMAAYKNQDDTRISAELRACYHADETLFWANAADTAGQRRINVRVAELALCIEALRADERRAA